MKEKKKLLAISGSTKRNSSNESILKFIANSFPDQLDVKIYEGVDQLPHFNPDMDREDLPSVVLEFRRQIEQADGVIFCTPEYVFSLPGSLKNAIEWNVSTTLFSNKPVAIIVAAASGEKAFEALDLIMSTIESRIAESSKLLIRGVKGKVLADGVIHDPATAAQVKAVVESLLRSMEEDHPVPTKYR